MTLEASRRGLCTRAVNRIEFAEARSATGDAPAEGCLIAFGHYGFVRVVRGKERRGSGGRGVALLAH